MLDMVEDQILSVCSGIGGLDIGFAEGMRAVGRNPRSVCMVEREAFPIAVLARQMQEGRMDECPLWLGDLSELPVCELPAIDWIIGGYPCQPFSMSGKRMGREDPRHLWPTILRHINTLQPGGVFFENVSGHLTLGIDQVLQDLERCGFRCTFGLFTAAEVGAPHRRERVFILGMADSYRQRLERSTGHEHGKRKQSEGQTRHIAASRLPSGTGKDEDVADPDDCRSGEDWVSSELRTTRIVQSSRTGGRTQSREDDENQIWRRWPAGPGEEQYGWEPSRTVERGVGGSTHGLSARLDRLRALGNSVVPVQATNAFLTLWKEIQHC